MQSQALCPFLTVRVTLGQAISISYTLSTDGFEPTITEVRGV